MLLKITTAIAIAAALGGCAYAGEPYGPQILSELPANAPPGECYARVRVPGQPVQGPPQVTGAQWVQTAGPPGSPGPIWCLVPTTSQAVSWTPDRYGFVRVLCEDDMTGARVAGIQRQLYSRGYYRGSFTGQYDAATAQAVAGFQRSAGLDHGGYLSMETVQALEAQQAYQSSYQSYGGGYAQSSAYVSSYASGGSFGGAYGSGYPCLNTCGVIAAPPPPPPPPPPVAQPCNCWVPVPPPPCPTACGGVSYGPVAAYGAQGYAGASAYAQSSSYGQAYYSGSWGPPGYGMGYGGVGFSPVPAYAAASASARATATTGYGYAGASASARASAVQGGWLTWNGR